MDSSDRLAPQLGEIEALPLGDRAERYRLLLEQLRTELEGDGHE